MEIRKKTLFVTLALLIMTLCFPFIAGAVGKPDVVSGEVMEITWMFRYEDSWCLQEIERKFNVDMISNGIYANDREKVSLMVASGEAPDAFTPWEPDGLTLLDEGIIRSIPKKMMKDNMPGYMKMLEENPMGWLIEKSPEKEDEYLGLLGIAKNTEAPLAYISFRVDWAKKVGVELPNYEENKISLDRVGRVHFLDESKTLDWFEKLLVAFRDGDPDGNGKIDTIPMMGSKYFYRTWGTILGAFGLNAHNEVSRNGCVNYEENGKLYLEPISPRYKEFLKLAARWYKMGLVDSELASLDLATAWERIVAKQVAVCAFSHIDSVDASYAVSRPPNSHSTEEEVAAGGEVAMLPPPIGPKGFQGVQFHSPFTSLGYNPLRINVKVSDKKLKKIMQIFEYLKFDEEGWIYNMYGKSGVYFKWQGDPWESAPIPTKKEEIPEGYPEIGKFTVYPPVYQSEALKFLYPKKVSDFFKNYLLAEWGEGMGIRSYRWDLFKETNMPDLSELYGEQLNTMIAEFYLGVLIGEINLDAEWDSYVEKWLKSGGNEVLEEMEKSPLVSELRKGKIAY